MSAEKTGKTGISATMTPAAHSAMSAQAHKFTSRYAADSFEELDFAEDELSFDELSFGALSFGALSFVVLSLGAVSFEEDELSLDDDSFLRESVT